MIRIIKGVFGYYNGRKIVPLTAEDGPQNLDAGLEARLVRDGIAAYVGNPETVTDGDGLPEYNESMKLDELKAIAAKYGVDASDMKKKTDVIAAIDAAKQEEPETVTDGEQPPVFDAADPV